MKQLNTRSENKNRPSLNDKNIALDISEKEYEVTTLGMPGIIYITNNGMRMAHNAG